eukprot:CAMPEP_0117020172 /NCGR_PEP_ID=MMETSP0472-20121206/15374_1 /TAXON_ID=693140 ORGANISM="Tiarina fusus, Strain LIS" /NCGR_SAMPLE_ID=MMETSP0472 /ASSEMBLY_ACC=CAM_ASM_000603 /LENGTH=313 /DNA_ID=CAMNT_0004725319 /DNA_START=158 /DNA_END=1099 /DNA_ORIENTATION=+
MAVGAKEGAICCSIIGVLLILILVPLTFSYVEYYEYGLDQRKTTGAVDTDTVYPPGRHNLGPDHRFIKYQGDAHYEVLDGLGVFSAGGSNESIGLEFIIDIDFTFLLIEDEIGDLHRELASNYRNVIVSRAKDAIKNEAIFVTFTEYFQARKSVEERFRNAVQARWSEQPSLHCMLDQFHLGRIQIPDSVANKQLESRVQNERNGREEFLQQAQLERELTAVEVNTIELERERILRTAQAQASLLRSKAQSEAARIKAQAQINGTKLLLEAAGFVTEDHVSAFSYIRTLRNRDNVDIDVSYLSANNVLRTAPA